jgi:RNA polymerase sigma-70 factor (ECF subfamily)
MLGAGRSAAKGNVIVQQPLADEALMLAFKGGDARAFDKLVQRHRGPVFNFLCRLLGDRARAEDLLQETWLKVVRSSKSYEQKAKFTTWLYTIARNLCVDASRRDRHRATTSLDQTSGEEDAQALGERVADTGPSPERSAHALQLREAMEQALQKIPAEQREVFLLREYAGVAFKDIAEVTGVPENTVKSRMRYALEGLRRVLQELGVEGDLADEPVLARSANTP